MKANVFEITIKAKPAIAMMNISNQYYKHLKLFRQKANIIKGHAIWKEKKTSLHMLILFVNPEFQSFIFYVEIFV